MCDGNNLTEPAEHLSELPLVMVLRHVGHIDLAIGHLPLLVRIASLGSLAVVAVAARLHHVRRLIMRVITVLL